MDERGPSQTIKAWQAIGFVWELLVAVALPTTVCALVGRWADRRFHLTPWITLIGLALALGISFILVKRKANDYRKNL